MREGIRLRSAAPFEAGCAVQLPAGAMHSFRSQRNEVQWSLVVEGDLRARGRFERIFPLVVHPELSGEDRS